MVKKKISIVLTLCMLLIFGRQGESFAFAEKDRPGSDTLGMNLSETSRSGEVGSTFKLAITAENQEDELEYKVISQGSGATKGTVEIKQYWRGNGVTSVEIPSQVDNEGINYDVVAIGKGSFRSYKTLESITLPKSITTIGSSAFENCESLKTINLPEGLTTIGPYAFQKCRNLRSIDFPESLEMIEYGAFESCYFLKTITLPEGISKIDYDAFRECVRLESVTLPDTIVLISYSAFWECRALKSINFPEGLGSISDSAFWECRSLESLKLPKSLWKIDRNTFSGCTSLTTLEILGGPPVVYYGDAFPNGGNSIANRKLVFIDEDGQEIAGRQLHEMRSKYKEVEDGDATDDKWHGWYIGTDLRGYFDVIDGVLEADYTPESWSVYQEILGANNVIARNTVEEVEEKLSAINDAIEQLVYIEVSNPAPGPTPDPEPTPRADLRESSGPRVQVEILKKEPDTPSKARISISSNVTYGTANLQVSENIVKEAIKKAQEQFNKNGAEKDGISIEIIVDTKNKKANNLSAEISKSTIGELTKAGAKEFSINSKIANISLDLETFKTIQNEINGDIDFLAKKLDNNRISQEAKEIVGNRPIFGFSITSSKGQELSEFGKGKISISMPYKLAEDEKQENIAIYYIDEKGNIKEMPNSFYDKETQSVKFITNHFSKFAVGYKESADKITFTDIENHWAKESIEFVSLRGLFTGTGQEKFSPDMPMTRGMFVTVLGRLENADVSSYKTSSFTDVKTDAYYKEYVEWASEYKIVEGISQDKFGPDMTITREQIAVILYRYSNYKNYDTTQGGMAIREFTDYESISDYGLQSMGWTVNTGILQGSDNKLMAKDNATRAEVASILMRFNQTIK